MRFTWIPYYKEFADKLLKFRQNRPFLLKSIYDNREDLYASYLHDEGGLNDLCTDIDPFSVFGLFNRGIREYNRKNSTRVFKELLEISADIPNDFEGVPVMNNQKSYFFGYKSRRGQKDIENLWSLFESVLGDEDLEDIYNTVIKQYGINVNITMALFWIRPNDFLALDSTNREYLKDQYNINLPRMVPKYGDYITLINSIKEKMINNTIKEKSFYELSANANHNENEDNENDSYTWYDSVADMLRKRKNIVLYGAPGTGKTYSIPEIAVRLCNNSDCSEYTREELMKRYNQLKHEKRIAFTTFHQSMDYEDWIEGLKPVCENNQVTYDIEKGIFKQLCEEAERPIVKDKHIGIADDAVVWKVSLSGTGDNPVRKECMQNGHIRIGWDDYGPVISEETDWNAHGGEGKRVLLAFIYDMKVGDVVMSCYSNQTIDAIGIVTGEYEFDDTYSHYKRVRKVNWILKGINENIVELNEGKSMTLSTVYRLNAITLDKVKSLLEKYERPSTMTDNNQPYIMVIDELNRGNVSKIFGELITLLETDKRKGQKNAESVILPYSKKAFMIPNNVFIIATMNTADRSLGTLDYAIRRRFAFVACKPYALSEEETNGFDKELFKEVSSLFISNYSEYEESEWNQSFKLLPADTLSSEYRPEDVWIGQSYFIMIDDDGEDITSDRLLYEIIPLLEEYVQDGVLTEGANETIERLYQKTVE
ncbi:MAG: AAA family ATPase [Bacteroidaceae bacterium]|nr:AAA family ATPase [Bacteroidaceae bacterium]